MLIGLFIINHQAIGVPRLRKPPISQLSPMNSLLSFPTGSARSLRLRKGVATSTSQNRWSSSNHPSWTRNYDGCLTGKTCCPTFEIQYCIYGKISLISTAFHHTAWFYLINWGGTARRCGDIMGYHSIEICIRISGPGSHDTKRNPPYLNSGATIGTSCCKVMIPKYSEIMEQSVKSIKFS